ncbi:hypothetical protein [Pseudooceanicola sp. C21-150M6]|uniref:hypothetical protein n=1 Tax=Pseudooceanicola sp. C21-150M6 TaxID=3434355 RepID=UPI003D7F54EC
MFGVVILAGFFGWLLIGWFDVSYLVASVSAFVVLFIVAILFEAAEEEAKSETACGHCGEAIKVTAKVCRFCNRNV